MKIRNGFVSNSSSSSFIVAVKNGTLGDSIDKIRDELPENIPFVDILDSVFTHIKHNAEEIDYESEYLENEDADSFPENKHLKELYDGGYTIYEVNVSSDDYEDGGIGMYLYENVGSINYESEDKNLIITDL